MYHLVKPPDLTDPENFVPLARKNPKKWAQNCQAHGLSVLKSRQAALAAVKQQLFQKRGFTAVASASLTNDRGKIAKTGGPNHYTWWVATGIPAHVGFAIIKED
ncbi:MAG TPA: hypothetical protein VKX17_24955 [Planctomycetota bacterium]|nr:hypothetical protein [Planctomycetota bacterium]